MSFILDALRKSENERREQAAPSLAGTPRATRAKKRTIWLPILAVVLAINALVFGALLLTRDKPAPAAAPASPPPAEPEVRSLRKETRIDATPAAHSITPSATPAAPPKAVAAPAPRPPKTEAVPTPPQPVREDLPSLDQLRAAGLVSVADLHIDMHVYSSDAAKRFVFINMNKYHEGDRLAEGPTLEKITPQGTVMVQHGKRFRLDRD